MMQAIVETIFDAAYLIPLYNRSGKLYRSPGDWKMDHIHYNDYFLCTALLCLETAVLRRRISCFNRRCLRTCRNKSRTMHDAAKSVA